MSCENEILLIEKKDFDCIAQVAEHCDWDTLCLYIRERQNLDLPKLLGDAFYTDIMDNVDDYEELLCGSRFEYCGGEQMHFGLKRILVHFVYGAYIYRHGYIDTPFGVKGKSNDDGFPIDIRELAKVRTEHRNIAYSYWEKTIRYLCVNKDKYPLFHGDCSGYDTETPERDLMFTIVRR